MRFPIKYKLIALIFILLLPIIVVSVVHYFQMLEHHKKDIQDHNLELSANIAKELDHVIDNSFDILRTLSKHPAVVAKNSAELDRLFAELLPSYPERLNILAADMDGNNYGSAVPSPGVHRLNYHDRDWFLAAKKGAPIVGDLHLSKLFKLPAVMIAMPALNDAKKQVGVIGMPLDLSKVREGILHSQHLQPDATITVLDSAGKILVCTCSVDAPGKGLDYLPNVKSAFAKTTGTIEAAGVDGVKRLYSFSSLNRAGWKVLVGVPVRIAYLNAYASSRHYIIIIAYGLLAGIGLSLLVSGKLAKNVSALITGMKELELGNLAYSMSVSGRDELGDVAESFNHMAEKRHEMEQKLTKSESFLTSVLEGIGEGVVVIDRAFRILSANKSYCDQVKMTCDDIIGEYCYKISHHFEKPCYEMKNGCDCTVQKCFETGEHHRAVHTHYDHEGKPVYIETNAYPIKDDTGSVVTAIETLMDITEKRSLEAQLFQAQKMESVGHLAGGIAHDFNNFLTAIIGYGHLAQMKISKKDPAQSSIDQILVAAEKAAGLTHGLLAFSRKQIINPKPVRLNDIITRLQKLLSRVLSEDIELKTFLSPHQATVLADVVQIEQILMNLATNARDAMPDGGDLILETEAVEFDPEYVRRHAFAAPGKYMLISVTDTGSGMDEKTREHIFEPFFTTKELGKGTGLGLSTVYGIVKQHNGYINVYSEKGKGTTFRIYFPVISGEAELLAIPALPPVLGGSETLLLAEDEASVRELSRNILEEYGYRVIVAEDGDDALQKFRENAGAIHCLILDIMMPKRNGKEVYDEISKQVPGMKVLFTSGYTQNLIHKKGILNAGIELITKPFSPNTFLRKVREVLDK